MGFADVRGLVDVDGEGKMVDGWAGADGDSVTVELIGVSMSPVICLSNATLWNIISFYVPMRGFFRLLRYLGLIVIVHSVPGPRPIIGVVRPPNTPYTASLDSATDNSQLPVTLVTVHCCPRPPLLGYSLGICAMFSVSPNCQLAL